MLVNQWEPGCESFNWHLLHGKPCFHDTAASSTPRHQAGENAYLYTLPAADLVRKTQFIIKCKCTEKEMEGSLQIALL